MAGVARAAAVRVDLAEGPDFAVGFVNQHDQVAVGGAHLISLRPGGGDHGLLAAFGTDFSAEVMLLRWA